MDRSANAYLNWNSAIYIYIELNALCQTDIRHNLFMVWRCREMYHPTHIELYSYRKRVYSCRDYIKKCCLRYMNARSIRTYVKKNYRLKELNP